MNPKTLFACVVALIVSGCSTYPERIDELDEARIAVNTVENDPVARALDEERLSGAREELDLAMKIFQEQGEPDDVRYHAYLAAQHARILEQRADEERIRDKIEETDIVRQSILLQARERDLERAESRADVQAWESGQQELRAERAEAVLERLDQNLESLQLRQTDDGSVFTLRDNVFVDNSVELRPGAEQTLRGIASYLEENPVRKVRIVARTKVPKLGPETDLLARQRAESVRVSLVENGIDPERVSIDGEDPSMASTGEQAILPPAGPNVDILVSNRSGDFPRH